MHKVKKSNKVIHRKDMEINRGIIELCNEEIDNFLNTCDDVWRYRRHPNRHRTVLTTAVCSVSSLGINKSEWHGIERYVLELSTAICIGLYGYFNNIYIIRSMLSKKCLINFRVQD